MSNKTRTRTNAVEAAVVTAICFGLWILLSVDAVLSGFPTEPYTDDGFHWMIGVELALSVVALRFLAARGYAVSALYPTPTLMGSGVGLILFVAAWGGGWLATAPWVSIVSSQPVAAMVLNSQVSLSSLIAVAMVNGTFEEVFLLGFLTRGLRGYGLSVALGVPLLIRALCHMYQGPLGVLWVMGFGLVLALYYVRWGQLWPPVLAHILWDIVPLM